MIRKNDPLWRAIKLLDIDPKRALWALLAGCLALGSAVALAAVSAWLIARASQMPPILFLQVAVVAVRTFGISRGVFRYLERLATHSVALRGMERLRELLYEKLAAGNLGAIVSVRRGDLLARVGSDVDDVGDVVVKAILPTGVAVVLSAGSAILVGVILPGAGIALGIALILAGVVAPALAVRAARVAEDTASEARSGIATTSMGLLDAASELTVTGGAERALTALNKDEATLAKAGDLGARPAALAAFIQNVAVGLSVLASLLLGIPATTAGTLDPVLLAVIVLTPLAAFEAANALPGASVQMQTSRAAARRIMSLLDASAEKVEIPPHQDPCKDEDLVKAERLSVGWPSRGVVLKDVDLTLKHGQSIAVVGPSGCGKTTLLLTLAEMIAPVDGDVRSRGHVAFTAEDAHVFNTTILENLRVARGDVSEAEAHEALEQAGLAQWLTGLPDGLNTLIGADAASISGGERRRLLLARALLTNASVLLVDEPAEHLDPETADRLLGDLMTVGAEDERAVMIVTHRITPLAAADEVIMLSASDGEVTTIAARGSHDELLATNEAYRQMFSRENPVIHQG